MTLPVSLRLTMSAPVVNSCDTRCRSITVATDVTVEATGETERACWSAAVNLELPVALGSRRLRRWLILRRHLNHVWARSRRLIALRCCCTTTENNGHHTEKESQPLRRLKVVRGIVERNFQFGPLDLHDS